MTSIRSDVAIFVGPRAKKKDTFRVKGTATHPELR